MDKTLVRTERVSDTSARTPLAYRAPGTAGPGVQGRCGQGGLPPPRLPRCRMKRRQDANVSSKTETTKRQRLFFKNEPNESSGVKAAWRPARGPTAGVTGRGKGPRATATRLRRDWDPHAVRGVGPRRPFWKPAWQPLEWLTPSRLPEGPATPPLGTCPGETQTNIHTKSRTGASTAARLLQPGMGGT